MTRYEQQVDYIQDRIELINTVNQYYDREFNDNELKELWILNSILTDLQQLDILINHYGKILP